jgi:hypothetical protein
MAVTVDIYIQGDFDIDEVIDWTFNNCSSFKNYKLVELDWKEKEERDCWFKLELTFDDGKDATIFNLRWI